MARYGTVSIFALIAAFGTEAANAAPIYWNLFNIEEENQQNSVYITYDTLLDMLNDTNRIGSFVPDSVGNSAENVVGSGAFVMSPTQVQVPEPPTLILCMIGLLSLGVAWTRKCARAQSPCCAGRVPLH